MFSKDITGSDAFLEMPASSQALYFHLGMEADDDGFIGNPKKVMRVIGVSEDDMKILLAKRFLLAFSSGIVVVKHHRINNNWDKYNCKRTIYLEEFSQLRIKDNRAYTLDKTQGIPLQSGSSLVPVFRIEENRIDKNTGVATAPPIIEVFEGEERPARARKDTAYRAVFEEFGKIQGWWQHKTQVEAAKRLLSLRGIEQVRKALDFYREHKDDPYMVEIHTPYDLEAKWSKLVKKSKV